MESTLTRRERERLMRRQTMLEAARAVFAEKGYANATIEEVAHRAEFGKGTLYNYFEGGKEDLLLAIMDEIFGELRSLIESSFSPEVLDGRPFRAAFLEFLESMFNFFMEREDLFLLLMKEAQQLALDESHEKAAYFMQQGNQVVEALVAPLQKAIDDGHLKPLPPHAVAHTILGNVKGCQMHICMARRLSKEGAADLFTPRQAAEFMTTVLLDGLLTHAEPVPSH